VPQLASGPSHDPAPQRAAVFSSQDQRLGLSTRRVREGIGLYPYTRFLALTRLSTSPKPLHSRAAGQGFFSLFEKKSFELLRQGQGRADSRGIRPTSGPDPLYAGNFLERLAEKGAPRDSTPPFPTAAPPVHGTNDAKKILFMAHKSLTSSLGLARPNF